MRRVSSEILLLTTHTRVHEYKYTVERRIRSELMHVPLPLRPVLVSAHCKPIRASPRLF